MTKLFIFSIPDNTITGFVEDKNDIPEAADTPVKEIDIHPAQVEYLNEAFAEFTGAQEYLTSLLYLEENEEETVQ